MRSVLTGIFGVLLASHASAQTTALTGATVFDGKGGPAINRHHIDHGSPRLRRNRTVVPAGAGCARDSAAAQSPIRCGD